MTPQSNPVDLDAIRARANAATKGPWETHHEGTYVGGLVIDGEWDWIIGDLQVDDGQDQEDYRGEKIKENCIFVANARQDIPALCDEIESLRERVKELEVKEEKSSCLINAVEELLEVANLRGDNDLPHPADDPKLWTARMQDAWDGLAESFDQLNLEPLEPKKGDGV
jgi:hypothetical protein